MNIRSMVIVGCGLLLGLISVIAIGLTIRSVTPRTLSLAYRIDADRTIFFVRTTDPIAFARAMSAYAPMMTAPPSQLASLPRGTSYEFALLSGTGNDQLPWMIYAHTGNQRHTTFVSADDPGLFLDVRDIGRSLGRSSVFLEGKRNAANLAFIDLSRLPLAGRSAASLARSIVAPFESAMVIWDGPRGQLNLRKKEKTLSAQNEPTINLLPSAPIPLLSMAISNPQAVFGAITRSFQHEDEPLYEGLKGILSAKLEANTHRTDLANAADDLLSQPTRLLITGNEKDGLRFVVTGHARNVQVADRWIEDVRSATTQARVRTQEFFKENSRRDVIADPSAYEERTMSGWTMVEVGSGSSRQFTIARKGDQIALGNDPVLLLIASNHLDQKGMTESGPRSFDGTVNIAWLTKAAGDLFPFLASDIRSLSEALLGTNIRRIDWNATERADSVVIRLRLTGAAEGQKGRRAGGLKGRREEGQEV